MKCDSTAEAETPATLPGNQVRLPAGILGFEQFTDYLLLANPTELPFAWLRVAVARPKRRHGELKRADCHQPPYAYRQASDHCQCRQLFCGTSFARRLCHSIIWRDMLILSRKSGESIVIAGNIRVKVVRVEGEVVKIGVEAPASVPVHRQEVYEEIQKNNQQAVVQKDMTLPKLAKPSE
jgi:carbon storage regulator